MKLYEGLFLIDAGRASSDWSGTESRIFSILERHGGAVREKIRYDERKLAYPVKGSRRGTYFLVWFDANPQAIQEINADLNLTDASLRSMITRVESGEIPEYDPAGTADPMGRRAPEPVAETPAEEKPAEEKPAEEAPASEEKPAEEKPADEKPAEEKPADEKPASEEKPAEEAPAEEATKTAAEGDGGEG